MMFVENMETERLRLRRLTENDLDALTNYFNTSNATVYLNINTNVEPRKLAEDWLTMQIRRYQAAQCGLHAIELKTTGEMIGQSGLVWQFVDGIPKWEVGYHLMPRYWGNGYATEAAMACRDFCFHNEMAETLISLIHPQNAKSVAVALRNGMTYWKQTSFKGNDCNVFRIRREDWETLLES